MRSSCFGRSRHQDGPQRQGLNRIRGVRSCSRMVNRFSRRDSCTSRYLQGIRKYPVLTREDEIALARRVRQAPPGDPSAHDLVMSNLAFVIRIANEYRNMGLPFEDLVSEGSLGVMEAARH